MEIIINIPKQAYDLLQNEGVDWLGAEHILDAVSKGTPLPEHYGRLGDLDALYKEIENGIKAGNYENGYEDYAHINNMDDCLEAIKYAETIIPATKAEKNCDTCQFDGMCPSNVRLLVAHNGCTTWTPKQTAKEEGKSCLNCLYYPNTAPCDSCDGYSNYNEWQTTMEGDK